MEKNHLEVVKKINNGDIEGIIKKYKYPLIKYFYWNTNNYEDALDLFQETCIKIYKNIEYFKNKSSLNTWIYKIAYNTMIGLFRYKKRDKNIEYNNDILYKIIDYRNDIELEYIKKENEKELWECIKKLSLKLKQAFLLKEMFDFTCREIGEVLNIPIGTVLSRLYRAQNKLIKHLNI